MTMMTDDELVALHVEYLQWKAFQGNDSFETFLYRKRLEEDAVRWRYFDALQDDFGVSYAAESASQEDYSVVLVGYESIGS